MSPRLTIHDSPASAAALRRASGEARDSRSTGVFRAGLADTMPDPGFLIGKQTAPRPAGWRMALQHGFREAVRLTRAEVGLLHVCGEAFLFTIAVHGLDPELHMNVAVSFWDDAMQQVLRGGAVMGIPGDGSEAGLVARRLRTRVVPRAALAIPVLRDGQVEAVLELGRYKESFRPGDRALASGAMHGSLRQAEAA